MCITMHACILNWTPFQWHVIFLFTLPNCGPTPRPWTWGNGFTPSCYYYLWSIHNRWIHAVFLWQWLQSKLLSWDYDFQLCGNFRFMYKSQKEWEMYLMYSLGIHVHFVSGRVVYPANTFEQLFEEVYMQHFINFLRIMLDNFKKDKHPFWLCYLMDT